MTRLCIGLNGGIVSMSSFCHSDVIEEANGVPVYGNTFTHIQRSTKWRKVI